MHVDERITLAPMCSGLLITSVEAPGFFPSAGMKSVCLHPHVTENGYLGMFSKIWYFIHMRHHCNFALYFANWTWDIDWNFLHAIAYLRSEESTLKASASKPLTPLHPGGKSISLLSVGVLFALLNPIPQTRLFDQ